MIYRPYDAEDFDQLYALEELCFEPPFRFSRRTMRALLQDPDSAAWIVEENGRMAGFAIVDWTEREGASTAYIQTIEISPDVRRRGVGRELLNWIECSASGAGASSIWLHVEAENAGAIRLYEAQGYTCQGRKENFYPLGRAGLVYMKRLEPATAAGPVASVPTKVQASDQASRTNQ